jgi:uncharacterized protein
MTKIGLLSDTHGYVPEKVYDFFADCNEVWHAGDIGTTAVLDSLKSKWKIKAVFGNIDGTSLRAELREKNRFICEDVDVLITHIGGKPGRYEQCLYPVFRCNPPDLFICGHSHILKVMNDTNYGFLHINPGAAGRNGLHQVCTAVRFMIDGKKIKDLEVLEIPRR